VAKGHYRIISQMMGIPLSEIIHYVEMIKSCNPLPANGFSSRHPMNLVPDILFEKHHGVWEPVINDRWTGSIGISKLYKYYCDNAENKEISAYLREKVQNAQLLLKSIELRRDTLLAISKIIIDRQLDFIEGNGELKILRMKDVAGELSLHSSTICRAVKDKYIQIPRDTLLMRQFFTMSGKVADDENFSAGAVIKSLTEIIEQEDKTHPLSDDKLAKFFEKEGLKISRRTISKYRTRANIPNASQRRIF
jgi:RNA polymerase sigma-54 factor